jgi:tripartite-type tricarboxylate transporter receptor subunit TctC
VLDKLRAALLRTLALAEVKAAIEKQGAAIVTDTPEEFRKLVETEIRDTGRVVQAAGLSVE